MKIIKTFLFSHYTQQVLKFTLNKVCSSCFTFSMKDKRHTYVTRRFLTCNVLKESWFIHEIINKSMHLSAVNLHDWRPSSISTPKISHVTENGQWLGINKKGNHTTHIGSFKSMKKKRNTTSNENNDGEIRRAYKNNYHSYNGGNENDNGRDTG